MSTLGKFKRIAFLAAMIPGVSFHLGTVSLNAERALFLMAGIPVMLMLAFARILGRGAPQGEIRFRAGWTLVGWTVVLLISFLLTNDFKGHLPGLLISILPLFFFVTFAQGGSGQPDEVGDLLEPVLWLLSLGGIVTYGFWLWYPNSLTSLAVDRARAHFSFQEPNIYGAAVAYVLILHFGRFSRRPRIYVLYGLCLTALALSFSKGPYVGFLAGAGLFTWLSGALKRIRRTEAAMVGVASVLGLLTLIVGGFSSYYQSHLDRADAISVRGFLFTRAVEKTIQHPLFGNGPLDFGLSEQHLLAQIGSSNAGAIWIGQMLLALAHDTGLVGLAFYLVFLVSLITFASERWRTLRDPEDAARVAGFVSLLIVSQVTTVHLTALFGLSAGLLAVPFYNPRLQRREAVRHRSAPFAGGRSAGPPQPA